MPVAKDSISLLVQKLLCWVQALPAVIVNPYLTLLAVALHRRASSLT